ncbi:MAG: DHA2 family efflux MFS transporter permease subunit, partial [Caulobacteraceae bacterium]
MTDGRSAEPPPMTGALLWTAGVVLALANFMVVLDTTIANVSVPNIAGGLAVSPSQGTWVITSYSVAEAITVPLTGWLAQRFGAVKVFVVAMTCFGLCSALCGIAPSLGVLVLFRVMQGLSGGPMIPLSQTLLRRIFPAHLQNTAIGLWAMTTVVAPIAGPLLGGALVDTAGWPWVFYINVPFALICAFFAWRLLASRETKTLRVPVDIVGLGLLILWVGAMQIMLDKGKDLDWFQSPLILGLAIVAAVGFVSFLIWELTDPHPIVDLKVFRHRGFAASTLIMCVVFGSFFASVVLIPLWLQTNMGYTATWAGMAAAPIGILPVFMSAFVGKNLHKLDLRYWVTFSFAVFASVSFWNSHFNTDVTFQQIVIPRLLMGFGVASFFVPLTGWLSRRFGDVRLFVLSTLLFTMASLLCGLATSLPWLIAARVLQGAVAGPMIPLSQSLLLNNYPPEKKGLALALWSMTVIVAPILGPIMGGWITDNINWPWIFYINLPVGIFSAFITWTILGARSSTTQIVPIDKVGLVLLVLGVGALQILLDKGNDLDWFESGTIATLAVISAVALSVLVVWELTDRHPVVDLHLFGQRNFLVG